MRVIFLDFDGVLNGAVSDAARDPGLPWGTEVWYSEQLDADKVERLNAIVDATGAVVVLSTSWRKALPTEKLRRLLQAKGFKGFILGTTPSLDRDSDGGWRYRAHEIEQWVRAAGVSDFVILDDLPMHHLSSRLVQTSDIHGLLDEHVEAAIRMLQG